MVIIDFLIILGMVLYCNVIKNVKKYSYDGDNDCLI